MRVRWSPGQLRKTSAWEYALRFAFGGAVTAMAGWVSRQYGPVIGGLFLAFPAILPAAVTLIERDRGTKAAGIDAAGAVFGSVGMLVFALVIWGTAARSPAWGVLARAKLVWFRVSSGLWWGWKWVKARGGR